MAVILLAKCGVYSQWRSSYWTHMKYILGGCHPIGHMWSIFPMSSYWLTSDLLGGGLRWLYGPQAPNSMVGRIFGQLTRWVLSQYTFGGHNRQPWSHRLEKKGSSCCGLYLRSCKACPRAYLLCVCHERFTRCIALPAMCLT